MARPLVVSDRRLALAFWPAVAGWLLFEGSLALRETRRPGGQRRGPRSRDAGPVHLVQRRERGRPGCGRGPGARAGPPPAAAAASSQAPASPGSASCLRVWSVLTLGRFFRLTVSAHADHELVGRGPYRAVRHPSYAGTTLIASGVGLALGTVAGAAAGNRPAGRRLRRADRRRGAGARRRPRRRVPPLRRAGPADPLHLKVIVELDLADDALAATLVELQQAAYRVEAELIGFADLPPLRDDVAALRRSGEPFLGACDRGTLAGAVSYRIDGDTLDVHRLVVNQARFRQGIGRRLLAGVEARAPRPGRVVVSTGAANAPARALYEAASYRETGLPQDRRRRPPRHLREAARLKETKTGRSCRRAPRLKFGSSRAARGANPGQYAGLVAPVEVLTLLPVEPCLLDIALAAGARPLQHDRRVLPGLLLFTPSLGLGLEDTVVLERVGDCVPIERLLSLLRWALRRFSARW